MHNSNPRWPTKNNGGSAMTDAQLDAFEAAANKMIEAGSGQFMSFSEEAK